MLTPVGRSAPSLPCAVSACGHLGTQDPARGRRRGECVGRRSELPFPVAVLPGGHPPLSIPFQVIEVGHFWGYKVDEKTSETLRRLAAEIGRLKLVPLPAHPHPDLVCLAPFVQFDEQSYFRAQILYVSGNSAEVRPSAASPTGE